MSFNEKGLLLGLKRLTARITLTRTNFIAMFTMNLLESMILSLKIWNKNLYGHFSWKYVGLP